ncbi:MAG: hypothetical protein ACK53Y_19645, partial [bacterium]
MGGVGHQGRLREATLGHQKGRKTLRCCRSSGRTMKGSWAIYGFKEAELSLSTILGPQSQGSFLRTLSGYQ